MRTRPGYLISTDDGGYVVARNDSAVRVPLGSGQWLVTAFAPDLTSRQGIVSNNESGFRGRHWESSIDGQQYGSLRDAMRGALRLAYSDAALAAAMRETFSDFGGGE